MIHMPADTIRKFQKLFIKALVIAVIALPFYLLYKYIVRDSIDKRLGYRHEDIDRDGIVNMNDTDVDGDGIPNMQDADADGDGIPNLQDTQQAAESLIGIPYDFAMGKYFNIGWRTGKIVCIDVINLSLEKAGLYMELEMKDYYGKHPDAFTDSNGKRLPMNSFFSRRVRNLRKFCELNGWLLPEKAAVRPGDIVIFNIYHTALVHSLRDKGYYAIETEQRIFSVKKVKSEDMIRRHSTPVYARLPFFKAK